MYTWLKEFFFSFYRMALKWQKDDGTTLAAAVAYYAAFSLFPLLLLLIAVLGFVLQFSSDAQSARQEFLNLLTQNTSPVLAQHVKDMLNQISSNALVGGPIGLATLLFAAIGVFTQLEHGFNRIWNVEESEGTGMLKAILNALYFRLRAFVMLLGLGLLVVAAFVAGIVLSAIRTFAGDFSSGSSLWRLVHISVSIVLFSLAFTVLYKILPKAKVRWLEALRGGIFAAILWEIARQLLTYFLIGESYTAYGIVGSLIALMLWIYIAVSIVFLGAEYVQVICQNCKNPT